MFRSCSPTTTCPPTTGPCCARWGALLPLQSPQLLPLPPSFEVNFFPPAPRLARARSCAHAVHSIIRQIYCASSLPMIHTTTPHTHTSGWGQNFELGTPT